MERKIARLYVCAVLTLASFCALGDTDARSDTLAALFQAVGNRAPQGFFLEGVPWVDCADVPEAELAVLARPLSAHLQWIKDAMYQWYRLPLRNGECIYVASPDARGLTRAEARLFIAATQLEFPVENPQTHEVTRCEDAAPPPAFVAYMPTLDGPSVAQDVPIPETTNLTACDVWKPAAEASEK